MTTTVTLTGTGVPYPDAGRAGAGVLVRHGRTCLQFDAGRATVLRLAEAKVSPAALGAVFLTHHHSDHVQALPDLALTRWVQQEIHPAPPLTVVCPDGPSAAFVNRMLDPFADDIRVRREHAGHGGPPEVDLRVFTPARGASEEVWRDDDGTLAVAAVAVHHEPVEAAVAYRVVTPDATVVISGDTQVCAEVEHLSRGADLLVHEVCRASALHPFVKGTVFEKIFRYHADSHALGAMADRADVPHVALTHLIPAPTGEAEELRFVEDLRAGGYHGRVSVGRDLMSFTLPEPSAASS
ncbi:MBL fold metallo-hydrolase [Streptomyces sp. NBC_00687]|uniref:MBL fold metallo-hydrolase n=1 Tax=Streptomyces sp. NBC_00687 TaxID=2975807 RepID=UPI00225305CA|nr:MBL fold metallo-hydrolase [Streptomyces sp. NBC_00687]MCX4919043.1 MBL fold metallo-hydrolase [Streptomyces sp. NBC_00687]